MNPFWVFLSSFFLAAFAGLAALLRSGTPLTTYSITSAVANSGLLGLGISLLWYAKYQDNLYFLVGICTLAGLGGMKTVEMVISHFRSGGFGVNLGEKPDEEKSEGETKRDLF